MPDIPATPAGSPSRLPGSDDDPIVDMVGNLITTLRRYQEQPDQVLTCDGLLKIVGIHSHGLAIFIFSLLNLLPAPRVTTFSWGSSSSWSPARC